MSTSLSRTPSLNIDFPFRCMQLLWLANASPASLTADIEFHTFEIRSATLASSQPVVIGSSSGFARLGASTFLRAENFNPSASLTAVQRTLRPQDVDIRLGSNDRDRLPASDAEVRASNADNSGQVFEMRLRYDFSVDGDKDEIPVRPCCTSLFHQLYDSPVDSQIWALEDANGQILQYGSSMHDASPVKLKKGKYSVNYLLRHPNRDVLDKLKDIPLEVNFDLKDAMPCSVTSRLAEASTPAVKSDGYPRTPLGKTTLAKGQCLVNMITVSQIAIACLHIQYPYMLQGSHQDIYVARPTADLPSWIAPGDVLVGSLKVDQSRGSVTSMKLLHPVPPKAKKSEEKKDEGKKEEDLEDVVFKSKLDYLGKIRDNSTKYEELVTALHQERPDSVPLLSKQLTYALEGKLEEGKLEEGKLEEGKLEEGKLAGNDDEHAYRAKRVEAVYNLILKQNGGPIDVAALAQYFGMNVSDDMDDDEDAKKLNKDMKEQRDLLRKVLLERASLLGAVADKGDDAASFDAAVVDMKKWVTKDSLKDDKEKVKLVLALARHLRICKDKKASAIAVLLKAKKDCSGKEQKEIDEELLKVYGQCEGMEHMSSNLKDSIYARFPVMKRGV